MTPFALCIAYSSISRTMAFELAGVRHRWYYCMNERAAFSDRRCSTSPAMSQRNVTLPILRGAVQLDAEAGTARLRSGGRAAWAEQYQRGVTAAADHALPFNSVRGSRRATGPRHVGLGRAA
jgi:hypothetical protein